MTAGTRFGQWILGRDISILLHFMVKRDVSTVSVVDCFWMAERFLEQKKELEECRKFTVKD